MEKDKIKQIKNQINIFFNFYFKIILVLIVSLFLFAGYLFIVLPKYKQISFDIEAGGRKENLEYLNRQKYYNQLKKLQAEYLKINVSDINKVNIMLPDKKDIESLLPEIEGIILKNGLLLTSIQVENMGGAPTDKGISQEIKKIKININVVGTDYVGFKNLLKAIENNLRLMDINNLSFDPTGNTTSLDITTYYLNSSEK